MDRVFVDTGAWFAHANRDDPQHDAVRAVLEEHEGRLVTSNFVLDEVVTLALVRRGHAVAVALGDALQEPSVVRLERVTPDDEREAWRLLRDHADKRWSYTDCTSFALMRRLGLETAVATDRHFAQAGFRARP